MKTIGIIPSRYQSSRLPGKPLALIAGKPMIQRVYEQCLQSNLDEVLVATDDERIFNTVQQFGGKVVLTQPQHKNGTERIAEAALHSNADVVVNIQGDEPFIHPEQINTVLQSFTNDTTPIATLAKFSADKILFETDSIVKVVFNKQHHALLFSRSAIPFHRGNEVFGFYKHIGIYGFKRTTLLELVQLPASPLEIKESLEQLRWLENGYTIKVALTTEESIAVDTPEDLLKAEQYAAKHHL
ncbi:MAG: 3-deoxy-manno-octulosonate cytidylyltransferase [Chitinophagales bacterium]